MQWRSVFLSVLLACALDAKANLARGEAPKSTAVPVAWRPLHAPCLPAPGPVYKSQWRSLKRLTANGPVELTSESGFTEMFGCPSGIDWSKERLVLLLLEVSHMNSIRIGQFTAQDNHLKLRMHIECGPGYDDHSKRLSGSHVFFALLLPTSSLRLDVQYQYVNVQTVNYQQALHGCSRIPSMRPENRR
jgi:hypothetical protein